VATRWTSCPRIGISARILAAAALCGTTHRTVRRVVGRREHPGAERRPRPKNTDELSGLIAGTVRATDRRMRARRLPPARRSAGYAGSNASSSGPWPAPSSPGAATGGSIDRGSQPRSSTSSSTSKPACTPSTPYCHRAAGASCRSQPSRPKRRHCQLRRGAGQASTMLGANSAIDLSGGRLHPGTGAPPLVCSCAKQTPTNPFPKQEHIEPLWVLWRLQDIGINRHLSPPSGEQRLPQFGRRDSPQVLWSRRSLHQSDVSSLFASSAGGGSARTCTGRSPTRRGRCRRNLPWTDRADGPSVPETLGVADGEDLDPSIRTVDEPREQVAPGRDCHFQANSLRSEAAAGQPTIRRLK
jgi:hypothetical protein